jgi:hypothetical protein
LAVSALNRTADQIHTALISLVVPVALIKAISMLPSFLDSLLLFADSILFVRPPAISLRTRSQASAKNKYNAEDHKKSQRFPIK